MASNWMDYANPRLTTHNMHQTPPKTRPTYAARMSEEQLAQYFRWRWARRPERFRDQRIMRLSRWDREQLDEAYPAPGLQRMLTPDVQGFDTCYYCLVSHGYSQTLPKHHPLSRYDGNTFYRVEVFANLGASTDPCIARVECLTVRGLRKRLTEALAALGPAPDLWGLLPVNEGWRSNLLDLILHDDTAPATRVAVFQQLIQKLSSAEAQELTQTLLAGIRSRQPGRPGYAAKHGLYALSYGPALDAQA